MSATLASLERARHDRVPVRHPVPTPDGIDLVKLPSVTKDLGGGYVPRSLGGEIDGVVDLRSRLLLEIHRGFAPDLVLTHRNNDYHPDHRAVGDAVRDASCMVTVPAIVPDAPILRKEPVVAFMPDRFTKPYPLQADVVVDVTKQVDRIIEMLACHKSQVFEWLPYNQSELGEVPLGEAGRRHWLREKLAARLRPQAERYRQEVLSTYGPDLARRVP